MTTLSSMTLAEQAYMARRLPRTYRSMVERARTRAAAGIREQRPGDRRRARLTGFDRRRHTAAMGLRLSSVNSRARSAPGSISYYETRYRRICELLIDQTGFEWEQLISHGRIKELVSARQAAMYLLLKHTHLNLPQVGALFGGRDHTTVIHARDKVSADLRGFKDIINPNERQLGVQ